MIYTLIRYDFCENFMKGKTLLFVPLLLYVGASNEVCNPSRRARPATRLRSRCGGGALLCHRDTFANHLRHFLCFILVAFLVVADKPLDDLMVSVWRHRKQHQWSHAWTICELRYQTFNLYLTQTALLHAGFCEAVVITPVEPALSCWSLALPWSVI